MKRHLIYLFLFLFFLQSIFVSGIIDSQDGLQFLAVARNIYYTGKPTAPVYEYSERKNVHMTTIVGKDGNTYSFTGLGFSLAFLPGVAITDIVYKIYHVTPPVHFPLESDWLILLTASFTNVFFASLLGVIIYSYLKLMQLSSKTSLILTFISLFATNLWVYSKHSFPHMMFLTFLFMSFFFLKIYSLQKRRIFFLFSGSAFGVTAITYNQTFLLAILPFLIYYLLLFKSQISTWFLKKAASDLCIFLLGLLPFIIAYIWFENLKSPPTGDLSTTAMINTYSSYVLSHFPVTVILEGLWGQLFSSGRSIFIYSPILLTIIFFWHKIERKVFPEFILFLSLSLIYITFYATTFVISSEGIAGLWHGESSWGPRYLIVLIPFAILIISNIYTNISKSAKRFVFYPLIAVGIFIQFLGIVLPYQTKFNNMEKGFYINNTYFTKYVYTELIPRYSPIFTMTKNLIKLTQKLPLIANRGVYNVRFYDGVDFAFNVGPERWRPIEGKGYVSFDNLLKDPIKSMSFGLINHPLAEGSSSAKIEFLINDAPLLKEPITLAVQHREIINIPVAKDILKNKGNQLLIKVEYDDPTILKENKQILGMISFSINDQVVNLESIDFPYVSPLGPAMLGVQYKNYGGDNKDLWRYWDIHTQMYERVPDFWWIRNFYYWDLPHRAFLILLIINIIGIAYFGRRIFRKYD